jgi:hypothetical protein
MAPSLTRSYSTRLYLWGAAKSAVYRDRPHTLNLLKTAVSAYMRNISQADLQNVFVNEIKRVQLFADKIKRFQACIDALGHHFQHLSECTVCRWMFFRVRNVSDKNFSKNQNSYFIYNLILCSINFFS